MSLQAILEAIRASGNAQLAAVEQETAAEAETLRLQALREAQQVQAEARARALQPAARERARIVRRAQLETLSALGREREALIDAALAEARRRLADIRNNPAYPQLLRRLVQEALDVLVQSLDRAEQAQLEADPRDRELLGQILQEMDLSLKLSFSADCWGGVIARSSNVNIVVFNTVESRLERATPVLRRWLGAHFTAGIEEASRPSTTMATPA
ncbi:MAG: hypothetical protein GX579_20645 [Chloroflexi bacterium]|nr:hypothetical protein [Chloroflexota bacterium]HKM24591.1 V-type ATP synthase subunit E [Corynebacterium sp.]